MKRVIIVIAAEEYGVCARISPRTRRLEREGRACTKLGAYSHDSQRHMQEKRANIFEDTHDCNAEEKSTKNQQSVAIKDGDKVKVLQFFC